MKSKLLLAAFALAVSTTAVAQDTSYARVFVGYHPTTLAADGGEDENTNGVALGWTSGHRISSTLPLYLEKGLGLKYNWKKQKENDLSEKFSALSLNLPVSFAYRFDVSGTEGLSFVPYAGLHLTANILGKVTEKMGNTSVDIDLFSKGDMGDHTAKRLQFGYQVGIGVNYQAFHLGFGYSAELTDYFEDVTTGGLTLNIGYNF